jgi:hypothetical protein
MFCPVKFYLRLFLTMKLCQGGKIVLEKQFFFYQPKARRAKICLNRPIRNKNCLWWLCLLTDLDKMCNVYRGPSIDASYQVSVHLAKGFQRRRIKCETLTDDRTTGNSCFWLADLNKSSPLKPLSQMNRHLVESIYGQSSIEIAHFQCLKWTVAQSPNATNILFGRPKAAPKGFRGEE